MANRLSKATHSDIRVGKASISFFNKMKLEEVLVSDAEQDTLFYIKKLNAPIKGINLASNNFRLGKIELEEPYLKIIAHNDSTMNLFAFLDALRGKTPDDTIPSNSSYFFSSSTVLINNGRFAYQNFEKDTTSGMNYDDLYFYNINAEIENLRNVGDTIKMDIKDVSTREKCGFTVNSAQLELMTASGLLRLNKVKINTPKSSLNARKLDFRYEPGTKAWSKFTSSVILDYQIGKSLISFEELAYFNSNFLDYNELITGSAHVTGTVENMTCRNVFASIYENTRFQGNLSMNGLPNLDETFIEASINNFQTTLDDLEKVKIPNYESGYLSFPASLKNLGTFNYKGKFTGFLADFVFYGRFHTDFGTVGTDLSLKPQTKTKQLELSGKIVSNDYQLGKLLQNKNMGAVSLDVQILNAIANDEHTSKAKVKGTVKKLELFDYLYNNIQVDALFTDNLFNGKLAMQDQNIVFDFDGHMDFSKEIPKTNFDLRLKKANLAALHLNQLTKDSIAGITFDLSTNISGGKLDDASGEIRLTNLAYTNSHGNLSPGEIKIETSTQDSIRKIIVKSDIVDAKLQGEFKLSNLAHLPDRILSKYISTSAFKVRDSIVKEQGTIDLILKQPNALLSLLLPGIQISNNTTVKGHYKLDSINDIEFQLVSDQLLARGIDLRNIQLKSKGTDGLISKLSIEKISLNDAFAFYNFAIDNEVANNQMHSQLSWDNKMNTAYKGKINLNTEFIQYDNGNQSIINQFEKSNFYVNNEDWEINDAQIIIDTTSIIIDKIKISNNADEYIELSGMMSSDQEDKIYFGLNNFNIHHFLGFAGIDNTMASGELSGFAEYKYADKKHTVEADLEIPDLLLKNHPVGRLKINSNWDKDTQKLYSGASLLQGEKKTLFMEGDYSIANDALDYTLRFDHFELAQLENMLNEYLTDIAGTADGELLLTGNTEKPLLNGKLALDIPKVTIAETGVSYQMKELLPIKNNTLIIKDFEIKDKNNRAATINGTVVPPFAKEPRIDLRINTKKLRIFADSYQTLAYGNAHISSNLRVTGDFNTVKVTGNVDMDNNSKIIVPFSSASEVADNDFITFINPLDSLHFIESKNVIVIPAGNHPPLLYNVDFHINPTSEIQVLFESKSGSTLKSKGLANLQISNDAKGNQKIIGQYTISQGSFFYSLEGLINKKFALENGGTIRWNGTPESAYVDMNAIYKVKVSIAPLLSQQSSDTRIRQTTVDCKIHITGQLENPIITFAIDFPNLDSTTKGEVQAALQTTDITKQVFSLLVLNKFTTPEYVAESSSSSSDAALSVTTSELLSSQLSNILSQLSDDVNIGLIYKPGDDLTKEELGVAISTELLQNRVVISGNLGFSSNSSDNSRLNDFVGDVDFDIKLNKSGSLRLRAFSHAKDNLYYYENKRNTQGVGVVYSEEFDSFKELWIKYTEKLGLRRKK